MALPFRRTMASPGPRTQFQAAPAVLILQWASVSPMLENLWARQPILFISAGSVATCIHTLPSHAIGDKRGSGNSISALRQELRALCFRSSSQAMTIVQHLVSWELQHLAILKTTTTFEECGIYI